MPALGSVAKLGVIPAVVLVASVSEGKPAGRAGIEPGDLIVAVDGAPLGSFLTFQETVLASKGRVLEILVARDGETQRFSIRPELTKLGDDGMERGALPDRDPRRGRHSPRSHRDGPGDAIPSSPSRVRRS